jgi:NAD(P)-dependent dehydrogenase (short-subunit alcohol dehydrogenase family)
MMNDETRSYKLPGRTAIVTGAGSGIGSAVARRLLANGVGVVAVDRDESGLGALDGARPVVMDLRSEDERARLVAEAGAVDYLVNAAGVIRLSPLEDVAPEHWDAGLDVNAKVVFFLTQAIGPTLPRGSAVVNIASTAGKTASTVEAAVYNVSKAAVIAMTKTFAYAYASRGVRVNCVCPGSTATPMLDTVYEGVAGARSTTAAAVEDDDLRAIPMKRAAHPDEIAGVVAFLLSDDAAYMTGQAVNVSGGLVTY